MGGTRVTDDTEHEEFDRLERKYGHLCGGMGPMSHAAWVMYFQCLEALEKNPEPKTGVTAPVQ